MAQEINKKITTRKPRLLTAYKRAVFGWVKTSVFMRDLTSGGVGSIASQFGLLAGSEQGVADTIARAIVDSTNIEFIKFSNNLSGSLKVNFQPKDFLNLLVLPEGFTSIQNSAYSQIHWMEWLIKKGDQVVVFDYSFVAEQGGRSGGGVMDSGGNFRVDPRYSGTEDNNVFTDMFKRREKQISQILQKELFL